MKILITLISYFLAFSAVACPNILGTWKSSKELSMEYNFKNANLEKNQIEFLSQTLGILKQTFNKSEIHSHGAPTIKFLMNGKPYDFEFKELHYKYELIACSENVVKVKEYYPYGEPIINQMVFENMNTFWVSPAQLPKSREYFIRVLN